MALHIQFAIHTLVTNEMEEEIMAGLMELKGGGSIERTVLDESPEVAEKRHQSTNQLTRSVKQGWPKGGLRRPN
ncbi:hypothetical protein DM860_008593 [Cuscuta australis]|uniref:Uncharacterized protein n=1 Tax=Cuscuta australis TaxID=267555 RepID=A0A328D5C8_9ASTE|nr:hypothetical protein DM860_008593 [Cuscuta australis]